MAQTVHLTLEIDGNAVEGESTIASMEREGTIECSTFEDSVEQPREAQTGYMTGRREYSPIVISKRIDKTTPLLFKALTLNEPVTKAEFRFFRPSPGGSGAEEHFYTVLLEGAHISSITRVSKDAIMGGEAAPPMMEWVKFVFQDITVTYEIGGATHTDSWKGEK